MVPNDQAVWYYRLLTTESVLETCVHTPNLPWLCVYWHGKWWHDWYGISSRRHNSAVYLVSSLVYRASIGHSRPLYPSDQICAKLSKADNSVLQTLQCNSTASLSSFIFSFCTSLLIFQQRVKLITLHNIFVMDYSFLWFTYYCLKYGQLLVQILFEEELFHNCVFFLIKFAVDRTGINLGGIFCKQRFNRLPVPASRSV